MFTYRCWRCFGPVETEKEKAESDEVTCQECEEYLKNPQPIEQE